MTLTECELDLFCTENGDRSELYRTSSDTDGSRCVQAGYATSSVPFGNDMNQDPMWSPLRQADNSIS
jgi:hypothetical protein